MARFTHVRHRGDPGAATRSERTGYSYLRYEPDPLRDRLLELDSDTWRSVAEAGAALAESESRLFHLGGTEALGRILLRAEAVASSRIEGLEVSPRRLLEEEHLARTEAGHRHTTAGEVIGNIDAMRLVIERIQSGHEIVLDDILSTHRELMRKSATPEIGGRLRQGQNWIGGATPALAEFVPPHPDAVEGLLLDLLEFVDRSNLPSIAIAAIAHAQFETIHPFADGNGRTGRALIHMVLRSRGATSAAAPPISLSFATHSRDYVEALTLFRYQGDGSSPLAASRAAHFVRFFSTAVSEVVDQMERFESEIRGLQATWRSALVGVRSDSAVWELLDLFPGMPVLTARSVQSATNRSFTTINDGLAALEAKGIIVQRSVGTRNRVFEVQSIITAMALFERRLASPVLDTASVQPNRPVPARPQH
ncbi:Fic family protein [Frondihabitans sp. PhB188]|uniref:Fic family protein n=1 Tax=Frondihabitans sp. PhB188 TaxID=2485200 RepID=UPI000F47ED4B|nr:Fic family protein [Frondihabitans sp. PhB188]ROQ37300.1 Fic family protein [Frondihabitans sp. PhB188]